MATTITPRVMTKGQTEIYVGGEEILATLESRYGIKPFIRRNRKMTRYDSRQIDAALDQFIEDSQESI
jgi:hypothetical protein